MTIHDILCTERGEALGGGTLVVPTVFVLRVFAAELIPVTDAEVEGLAGCDGDADEAGALVEARSVG